MTPTTATRERELAFSDRDFTWIQRTVKERVGIDSTDVERADSQLRELIDSVATNVPYSFREGHHFERLAAALPEIVDRRRADERIRCRNVVTDFDEPTGRRFFARFAERLRPGGHLFVGHSESLHGVTDDFEFVGNSSYRRRS